MLRIPTAQAMWGRIMLKLHEILRQRGVWEVWLAPVRVLYYSRYFSNTKGR